MKVEKKSLGEFSGTEMARYLTSQHQALDITTFVSGLKTKIQDTTRSICAILGFTCTSAELWGWEKRCDSGTAAQDILLIYFSMERVLLENPGAVILTDSWHPSHRWPKIEIIFTMFKILSGHVSPI